MAKELFETSFFNDASLRAYYRLENVNDSKNSYNLTNTGSVTFTTATFNNGANMGASNTTKYLSVASNLGITTGAITMMGWVKNISEIGSGSWDLIHHSHSTGAGNDDLDNRILYEYNGGTRRLNFSRLTNISESVTSNLTMGTTDTYHIAYVYNGSTVEGYVNGISIGSVSATSTTYTNDSGSNFRIGSYQGTINVASSLFDDVAVFSRALTSAEILRIYTGRSTGSLFFGM